MTKKLILFLTLGAFAFFSSCGSDDNKNSTPPIVGTWKVVTSEFKVKGSSGPYQTEQLESCYSEYNKMQFFADKSVIITTAEEDENDPSLCDIMETKDASWTLDGNKLTVTLRDGTGTSVSETVTVTFTNSNNRMISSYEEEEGGVVYEVKDTYEKIK